MFPLYFLFCTLFDLTHLEVETEEEKVLTNLAPTGLRRFEGVGKELIGVGVGVLCVCVWGGGGGGSMDRNVLVLRLRLLNSFADCHYFC